MRFFADIELEIEADNADEAQAILDRAVAIVNMHAQNVKEAWSSHEPEEAVG